jgi:dienelactone hydrolase
LLTEILRLTDRLQIQLSLEQINPDFTEAVISTAPDPHEDALPVISVKPVLLPASGGGERLPVRVSASVAGTGLPVVLFSHGFGSSLEAYGPLTDYWAARGFVVVQPTYLDSRRRGLPPGDPRAAGLWRSRVQDATRILDCLDVLEAAVPGLPGRADHGRIAAAGHSFGGQTSALLLGLRVLPPGGDGEDWSDPRVSAGVLLATAGAGGENLRPGVIGQLPWLNVSFEHMQAPALVVAGDRDQSPLTVRGPDWSADPYHLSPGPKTLLTLAGAEHSLGGIPGYEAAETTDEDPARLAALQRITLAYLREVLGVDRTSWPAAVASLEGTRLSQIESREGGHPAGR